MGDKMVRTTPGRPADGMVGWFYESFVPGEDCRGVGRRGRLRQLPHQTDMVRSGRVLRASVKSPTS
ncbi:hypothetical protein CLOSYM_04698 [[Clostridium] symbiosum ATCC 14940]|uniref:Uncharacterized protein n=1 Tax=[Clostridium] symbiosum ATCC 14940 TaxID=411472 RepID=A0ABC9TRF9_CLOSY|nr:hypothetical protein CLOSYM_04698 [[Clostridium] symbiosum ATCC 14940]